jgi:hypothetical protein
MSKNIIPTTRIAQAIGSICGQTVRLDFGERTRLARWQSRSRPRKLFLPPLLAVFKAKSRFSARRRKKHPERLWSPA